MEETAQTRKCQYRVLERQRAAEQEHLCSTATYLTKKHRHTGKQARQLVTEALELDRLPRLADEVGSVILSGRLPLADGGISLKVGRTQRLVTPAIRAVLLARDRGCVFPGCDRPPGDCDAHHVQPWWSGGPTSLALLCPHHNRTTAA